MVQVDEYLQIRLLHRDGLSIRQIARRLGHGRETVKKALSESAPRPYTRSRPVAQPKLGPFVGEIERMLREDESAPRKQRHTAARVFARLREEHGYGGGYDQVRRFVAGRRGRERETFLLLDHPPGARMECDFGHIRVDFPEGRRAVAVLLAAGPTATTPSLIALPNETDRVGAAGAGLRRSSSSVACRRSCGGTTPRRWRRYPARAGAAANDHYAALASHYRFAPMFCMPAGGQEKARRGADGVRPAAAVRHAGAGGGGPGRA